MGGREPRAARPTAVVWCNALRADATRRTQQRLRDGAPQTWTARGGQRGSDAAAAHGVAAAGAGAAHCELGAHGAETEHRHRGWRLLRRPPARTIAALGRPAAASCRSAAASSAARRRKRDQWRRRWAAQRRGVAAVQRRWAAQRRRVAAVQLRWAAQAAQRQWRAVRRRQPVQRQRAAALQRRRAAQRQRVAAA